MTIVMVVICILSLLAVCGMWWLTDRAIKQAVKELGDLDDYNIDLLSRLINARAVVLRSVMRHLEECPTATDITAKCDCGTSDYNTVLGEILINLELDEVVVAPPATEPTAEIDKSKLN